MMENEKLWFLVNRLLEKTEENALLWKVTETKADYQVSFPKYSVRIGERDSKVPGDNDYIITIIDEKGDIVESKTDMDIHNSGYQNVYETMKNLYGAARRQARGVDKALDDLLGELDDDL